MPSVATLALPGDGGAGDRAEHARFNGETAAGAARLKAAEVKKMDRWSEELLEPCLARLDQN